MGYQASSPILFYIQKGERPLIFCFQVRSTDNCYDNYQLFSYLLFYYCILCYARKYISQLDFNIL